MKRKAKFFIIGIIGIISFSTLITINFNLKQTPDTIELVTDLNLHVDYNNGSIKIRQNFTLSEGKTTVFDALALWCELLYDDYGWGIIVREIDGVGGNWLYYVNDVSPSVGSDLYPLENGDSIRWEKN
ncbi:MAG: DUF4430 domain-containing protein [Promethearchaeota archaeon]|nr:MAG: DUF4430 domain-containing protein [Candidatus Lokiarchaeota archaeon]